MRITKTTTCLKYSETFSEPTLDIIEVIKQTRDWKDDFIQQTLTEGTVLNVIDWSI